MQLNPVFLSNSNKFKLLKRTLLPTKAWKQLGCIVELSGLHPDGIPASLWKIYHLSPAWIEFQILGLRASKYVFHEEFLFRFRDDHPPPDRGKMHLVETENQQVTSETHPYILSNSQYLPNTKNKNNIYRSVSAAPSHEGTKKKPSIYFEIISYLNKKTGKKYRHSTPATQRLINARIKQDGATLEDFKYIIDVKCAEWLDNPEMKKYLRPETLFRACHFDSYLNQDIPTDPEKELGDALRNLWEMGGSNA